MEPAVDLAARLTRLEDLQQIRDLKMRYARYADAGYDAEGLASLFAPDAVWDGGALFGRAEGTEALRAHFAGAPAASPGPCTTCSPPSSPSTRTACMPPARGTCGSPAPAAAARARSRQAWLAGTYQDTYVKLDGVWRFQTVEVRARWLEAPPSTLPPA